MFALVYESCHNRPCLLLSDLVGNPNPHRGKWGWWCQKSSLG
jgi:hypothetical protein